MIQKMSNTQELITFSTSGGTIFTTKYNISLVLDGDAFFLKGKLTSVDMGLKQRTSRHSVKVSKEWANEILGELRSASIPPMPQELPFGCDAVGHSLTVCAGFAGATYSWIGEPPNGWEILSKIANKIIFAFGHY